MSASRLAFISLFSLLAACDSGADGGAKGPAEPKPAASVALDQGALVPGSEWEKCWFVKLDNPEPFYVQRISASASGMHHLTVQTTSADFPDSAGEPCFAAPERLMDADGAPRTLFNMATGTTSAAIDFPADRGYRIEAHQQLMIDWHALNYRPEDVPVNIAIDFFGPSEAEGADLAPMAYAVLSNTDVELAADSEGEVIMQCEFPFDVDFVTLGSHMHTLGKASEVSFVSGTHAGEVIHSSGNWNDGGLSVYDPPLRVAKGDTLEIRCEYNRNETGAPIVFGPQAKNEMCQIEGYVLGADTIIGGTAKTIGIEDCMLIQLNEQNEQLYRQIIEVFTPTND